MEHSTRCIGQRIKRLRLARGLTAATLAERVGVTENAIRKIESGDSKEPRFSTGVRIAQELKVRPEQIVAAPPKLESVLRVIRNYRDELNQQGIAHASVFGSVARGTSDEESDIDILVEPASDFRFSLFNLSDAHDLLQGALGRNIDILTPESLSRAPFAEHAKRELVRAF